MKKEFYCKHCKQILFLESKQIGGHVRNCKDNPERERAYSGFRIKGPELTLQRSLLKQLEYSNNLKFCKECNKQLEYKDRNKDFCNSSCAATFNNKFRNYKASEETKLKVKNSLLTRIAKEKGLSLEEYLESKKNKVKTKQIRNFNRKGISNKKCIKKIKWICPVCNKELELTPCEAKKRKYCNGTCRNKVNNKIIYGTRSKAERFLEGQLKVNFPNLEMKFNTREILENNKELDVFIPSLNLAIEWNGVYHYCQTRNGELEKSQKRDKEKVNECINKNINLIVIKDLTSSNKFIKEETKKIIQQIKIKLG